MLGVCFAIVLSALDQTLINVALPRIVAELNGFALYSWVGTAYLLTSAIALPITGRLGDLFGRKRFVLAAVVIFLTGSAGCALADSMTWLLVARIGQGIGSGMLVGTTFACVADIFPDRARRMRWQIMLSSAFGISNLSGPSLGGFLTEHYGWRSIFLVTLPVGLAALIVIALFLPAGQGTRRAGERIDWLGAALLALVITLTLLAIQAGAARAGQGVFSLQFVALVAGALLTGWQFIRVQHRVAQPILPLHLFALRGVRLLALVSLFGGASLFVLMFYAPLLLQAGFGFSPNTAGMLITPLVAGIAFGSLINGRLFNRLAQPHRLLPFGLGCFAVLWLAVLALAPGMPAWLILLVFGATGLSLGFLFPNLVVQMQSSVARQDMGVASALVQSSRMLGNMAGVALAGVLVFNGYHASFDAAVAAQQRPAALAQQFTDPQALVNVTTQATLRAAAQAAGPAAVAELEATLADARGAIIDGVHRGFWMAWGIAILCFLIARRVPPLRH